MNDSHDGSEDGPLESTRMSYAAYDVDAENTGLGSPETEDDKGPDEPLREQDRFLPIANVARIMKKAVPQNGKIAKDAKECVQECVSEFISFITSEASERCHQEKRKTINGEDILFAMSTLGFDNYVEPLKLYLQKYRECSKGEKGLTGLSAGDGSEQELSDDMIVQSLTNGTMLTEQNGQSVIYTTAYPAGQGSGMSVFTDPSAIELLRGIRTIEDETVEVTQTMVRAAMSDDRYVSEDDPAGH